MYRKENHHYKCWECNMTFSTAPYGKCPNGHENFVAIGWLQVEKSIREHWFRKLGGKNESEK